MHHPPTFARAAGRAALLTLAALALPARAEGGLSLSAALGPFSYKIESSADQVWKGSSRATTLGVDYSFAKGYFVGLSLTKVAKGDLKFSFEGNALDTDPFVRTDYALTAGMALADRWSTFFGLKRARSEIDTGIDTRFETSGLFVGLARPFAWGASELVLSGAVGYNTGKWKDSTGEISDRALGYSGGLKYSYAFNPQLAAGVGLKFQGYSYDFTQLGFGTVDESIRAFEVFVNYAF